MSSKGTNGTSGARTSSTTIQGQFWTRHDPGRWEIREQNEDWRTDSSTYGGSSPTPYTERRSRVHLGLLSKSLRTPRSAPVGSGMNVGR